MKTLINIGVSVGLNGGEIKKMYETDEFVDAVRFEQYEVQRVGTYGVPFFVFIAYYRC